MFSREELLPFLKVLSNHFSCFNCLYYYLQYENSAKEVKKAILKQNPNINIGNFWLLFFVRIKTYLNNLWKKFNFS